MTTHRVYLRWVDQRVTDKTTTTSEAVAAAAFGELEKRPDLVGRSDVAIAWTADGKQRRFYRFDAAND